MLRKELIDKVIVEFPHLKTLADNIEKAEGLSRKRLENNFAQVASNLVCSDLTPMEILEIAKISNIKI